MARKISELLLLLLCLQHLMVAASATRDEARWSKMAIFIPLQSILPLGGSRRNVSIRFGK